MAEHIFNKFSFIFAFFLIIEKTESQGCGPPPQVLPESCCLIPPFFDDTDLIRCKSVNENFRVKRFATYRMGLGTCYLDCVFQITNVTFAGGSLLDTNRLLRILTKDVANEPGTVQIINNVVAQCVAELNGGTLKVRNPTTNNCSTIPSSMMLCIHKKFFLNCPPNRFQNQNLCIQLRDYMSRCAVNI